MPAVEIKEISLDGFQVVSGDLFMHYPAKLAASCTLWNTSISFSKMALEQLNMCERIRIEVNPQTKCLLIVPATENDRDSVRWKKGGKYPTTRKIDCRNFTTQLYEQWGWQPDYVFRTTGQLVTYEKKVMLLFDFSKAENWKYKDKNESINIGNKKENNDG